ncbi:MAG: DinB family protein [Calothrix sp. MO_192.B10]|nr:DinB family protein [Calothrix sp. MO_192.B10]
MKQNFALMSQYNQWMNQNIYNAVKHLNSTELSENCGLFFDSILGTLNHLLVADIIWLKRFANHPTGFKSLDYVRSLSQPLALNQILYSELPQLRYEREKMDEVIINCFDEVSEQDYEVILPYENTKKQPFEKRFGFLVHHFFNHQTHHRGQLTTILSQRGIDFGVTDLLVLIPNS